MFDQGVVSLGNFLTTIFIARAIGHGTFVKADYGLFNVVLEFMFFLNTLHAGLITFPLTIKGAVADDAGLRRFATASMLFTLLFALPVGVGALVVGAISGKLVLGLIAALALFLWQLQETMRRTLWAHFRHADSIIGDAIGYLGLAATIWMLIRADRLSLPNVFLAMAATNAVAVLVQALRVGVRPIAMREIPEIAVQFFRAGRWVALTNLATIATAVCGSWALWLSHGANEVADFFAIGNLLKLCNPIISSIGGLIVPAAARANHESLRAAATASLKYAALGGAMLAPYLLFAFVFPTLMFRLFYGPDSHFFGRELALQLSAIGYVAVFAITILTGFLNGVDRSHYTFYGQVVGFVGQFAILLPMNLAMGLMGYVIGGVISLVFQIAALLWLTYKAFHSAPPTPPTSADKAMEIASQLT